MTFPDFCRALGLIPPLIIEPGRWHRCATEDHPKSRNGALKLASDGETGWAQDHGTMHEVSQWWRDGENKAKADPEKLRQVMTDATRQRVISEATATAAAWLAFREAKPLRGTHPYLHKKRLTVEGCQYLRKDASDRLLVRMNDEAGKMRSLQSIDHNGLKKFWLGAPASGCRYMLARSGSTVTILCEGLSTGLTLYCACQNASVVVCFSAANMVQVAKSRKWTGMVVVAGDNDADTEERIGRNPGVVAAKAAAEAIGCGTAIPASCGDWNDVFCANLDTLIENAKGLPYVPNEASMRKSAMMAIRSAVMRNSAYLAP